MEDVPLGQNPDQAAEVADDGRADAAALHFLRGLAERVLGRDG